MLSLGNIAAAAIRTAYDFSARDGSMWISDGTATLEFIAKGASWFGGETELYCPHELWKHSTSDYIDFLARNDFNAIRLPTSVEAVLTNPRVGYACTAATAAEGRQATADERRVQGVVRRQIGPVPDGVQVAQVRGLRGVRRRRAAATAAARRGPVLQLVPQHDHLVPMEEVHGLQRLRVIYCVE